MSKSKKSKIVLVRAIIIVPVLVVILSVALAMQSRLQHIQHTRLLRESFVRRQNFLDTFVILLRTNLH